MPQSVEKQIETAFNQAHTFSYSEALDELKYGRRVARAGWNGKGMFIFLEKGSAPEVYRVKRNAEKHKINGVSQRLFEVGARGTSVRMPCLCMRAANGETVVGWLASQTDMLAEDWVSVA